MKNALNSSYTQISVAKTKVPQIHLPLTSQARAADQVVTRGGGGGGRAGRFVCQIKKTKAKRLRILLHSLARRKSSACWLSKSLTS